LYPSLAERTFFPVDWFNAVDTTYKADLRDLIEVQAQRFDAKLEQRLAETRADLRSEISQVRAEVGQVRAEMGVGFAQVRTEMATGSAALRAEMGVGFAKVRTEMASLRAELIKWMFLFWLGTVAAAFFTR
jgi:predicted component of type VI protein secretion system